MCIISVSAGNLENQIVETISKVEESQDSGANVDDLIDRLNVVIWTLDECGWENCSKIIINDIQLELKAIQLEAGRRKQSSNYWLPIILSIFISLIFLEKRYSLIHKLRWSLIKNRKILYEAEEV